MRLMSSQVKRIGMSAAVIFGSFVLVAAFAEQAAAHKFVVTAWVEDDTVYVESGFSDGSPAKNAKTEVYDDQGKMLIEGQTNEYGEYSFKVPKRTAMRVVIKAGMGHQAESEISLEDFGMMPSEDDDGEAVEMSEARTAVSPEVHEKAVISGGLTANDIQIAVEKALDKKLKPIKAKLLKADAETASINDIFGGIGYILGLVGIGAYFNSRKKAT